MGSRKQRVMVVTQLGRTLSLVPPINAVVVHNCHPVRHEILSFSYQVEEITEGKVRNVFGVRFAIIQKFHLTEE